MNEGFTGEEEKTTGKTTEESEGGRLRRQPPSADSKVGSPVVFTTCPPVGNPLSFLIFDTYIQSYVAASRTS